MKELGEH